MYLLAIGVFIMVVVLFSMFSGLDPMAFMDIPSLIYVILLIVPMLAGAGLLKDFVKAFPMAIRNDKSVSAIAMKRSLEGVRLVGKLALRGGILITVFAIILICDQVSDPAQFGVNLGVAAISALYGIVINILLLPIQSKLKMMIAEKEQEDARNYV